MKKLAASVTASLLFVGASTGCGGGSGSDPVPLEDFGARTAESYCVVLAECYGPDLLEAFVGADCATYFERIFSEQTVPRWEEAIADGTVTYDPASAGRCLDQLESQSCGFLDRPALSDCEAALMGSVAAGGGCSIDEQCAGDAYCDLDASCPGTCQALVSSGGVCSGDSACAPGLRCDDGTCGAPALLGAPCEGGTSPQCSGGLICQGAMAAPPGGTGTPGTCRSASELQTAALDDACDPQGGPYCQPGLSCALTGVSGMMGVFECVAEASTGGACNFAVPDMCPSGQVCDATPLSGGSFDGTCQPLPTSGDACVQGRCADGNRCADDVCSAISGIGGACSEDSDCYSNNCASGTCAGAALCGG